MLASFNIWETLVGQQLTGDGLRIRVVGNVPGAQTAPDPQRDAPA